MKNFDFVDEKSAGSLGEIGKNVDGRAAKEPPFFVLIARKHPRVEHIARM